MHINAKTWLKAHWKPLLGGLLLCIILVGGAWAAQLDSGTISQRIERNTSTQDETPITEPAPLTGVEVEPHIARRPITAVMLENSPNARPQTGLDSAGIVFEAVAEGGITRFLAFYQDTTPQEVGPIRSLRPYFVDWFMGFDAAVAHVGGSGEALQLVDRRGAKSLNEMRHSGPYFRSSDRLAPHNMYASMSGLRDLQRQLNLDNNQFKTIPRSDDSPSSEPNAPQITIDFSSSLYQAQFRYDSENNNYRRFMAGSPHIDRATGNAIRSKNVVVIKMPTTRDGQYEVMQTIGSGDALLFKDGTVHEIRWRQSSYNDRVELIDANGNEVALNRGDSWFSILPSGRTVSY